jgi:hypothetical protein
MDPDGRSILTATSPAPPRPRSRLAEGAPRLRQIWTALWDRATVSRLLAVGLPAIGALFAFTAIDLFGQATLWENGHWTLAGILATAVAISAAHQSHGRERRLRRMVALAAACWAIGQLAWDVQTAVGFFAIPAPSDIGFLLTVVPAIAAFGVAVQKRLPRVEEVAVYLDAAALFLAISAAILTIYGDDLTRNGTLTTAVTLACPIVPASAVCGGMHCCVPTTSYACGSDNCTTGQSFCYSFVGGVPGAGGSPRRAS